MGRTGTAERTEKILLFAEAYRAQEGIAPTEEEIAAGTGIPRSTVTRYLSRLKKEGAVRYDGRRSLRPGATIPLAGAVACGERKEPETFSGEYVSLPLPVNGPVFTLRADGCSMINAGIDDGDLVFLRPQSTAVNGQIVSALVDGEGATLKRFYRDGDSPIVYLRPENDDFNVQEIDLREHTLLIQGVAVGVYKTLE